MIEIRTNVGYMNTRLSPGDLYEPVIEAQFGIQKGEIICIIKQIIDVIGTENFIRMLEDAEIK